MPKQAGRIEALTIRRIEKLEPKAARYRVSDAEVRGLKLCVEPSGRKYWTVRYVVLGKESETILGEWPGMLIEAARTQAGKVRNEARTGGVDPVEAARKRRQAAMDDRALTFQKISEQYLAASSSGAFGGKNGPKAASTIDKERLALRVHVWPVIGHRPIRSIETGELVEMLDGIVKANGRGRASRNSSLGAVRRTFAYARHLGVLKINPAAEISVLKSAARDVVASDAEIRKMWLALEARKADPRTADRVSTKGAEGGAKRDAGQRFRSDGRTSARVLQLSLLTLQRRGEVVRIHRDHVNFEKGLWTIPALNKKERRKGGVPLVKEAIDNLREAFAESGGQWAFPGRDPKKHVRPKTITRYMARLRKREGVKEITPHDLRRTGRTKLTGEELLIDEATAERVLNHSVGGKQQNAYDWNTYLPQKRAALEAWASELHSIVYPDFAPRTNVVAIKGAGRGGGGAAV